jgi:hypothetical protein
LPLWSARDEREKNAMRDWMFYQLEDFYRAHADELGKEPIDPEAGDTTILELLDSSEASERERGLALLRQLNARPLGPDADRLQWKRPPHRPKGKPPYLQPPPAGQHYGYPAKVHMAKNAVPIIQNIWRKHYDGKWQRRSGDIDAYEIAAAYFCVDVEAVRAKASGRHKPRAKHKQP